MGVPTSEVGYTAAMPRREDHEVHKDMWWQWTKKISIYSLRHADIYDNGEMHIVVGNECRRRPAVTEYQGSAVCCCLYTEDTTLFDVEATVHRDKFL